MLENYMIKDANLPKHISQMDYTAGVPPTKKIDFKTNFLMQFRMQFLNAISKAVSSAVFGAVSSAASNAVCNKGTWMREKKKKMKWNEKKILLCRAQCINHLTFIFNTRQFTTTI